MMLGRLIRTDDHIVGLIARLTLGIVILPHGLQKLLGLFGGLGYSATIDHFVQSGMPAAIAVLVVMGESVGTMSLIVGFLSRFAAFGIGLIMLGAILLVHLPFGFFMNWTGDKNGEGFEFHLLAMGLSLIIMIQGGGKWSVDKLMTKNLLLE